MTSVTIGDKEYLTVDLCAQYRESRQSMPTTEPACVGNYDPTFDPFDHFVSSPFEVARSVKRRLDNVGDRRRFSMAVAQRATSKGARGGLAADMSATRKAFQHLNVDISTKISAKLMDQSLRYRRAQSDSMARPISPEATAKGNKATVFAIRLLRERAWADFFGFVLHSLVLVSPPRGVSDSHISASKGNREGFYFGLRNALRELAKAPQMQSMTPSLFAELEAKLNNYTQPKAMANTKPAELFFSQSTPPISSEQRWDEIIELTELSDEDMQTAKTVLSVSYLLARLLLDRIFCQQVSALQTGKNLSSAVSLIHSAGFGNKGRTKPAKRTEIFGESWYRSAVDTFYKEVKNGHA